MPKGLGGRQSAARDGLHPCWERDLPSLPSGAYLELLLPEKKCTPLPGPLFISSGPAFLKVCKSSPFPTFAQASGFFLEFSRDVYCLSSVYHSDFLEFSGFYAVLSTASGVQARVLLWGHYSEEERDEKAPHEMVLGARPGRSAYHFYSHLIC